MKSSNELCPQGLVCFGPSLELGQADPMRTVQFSNLWSSHVQRNWGHFSWVDWCREVHPLVIIGAILVVGGDEVVEPNLFVSGV